MLAYLGGNLSLRHFVSRFQFHREATNLLGDDAPTEFALGFTRTKDQQRVGSSNRSNYVIVVVCAIVLDPSV